MLFCAEIGSNHKGIPSLAYEMIRQSALAGADLVKFQLGHWKPKQPGVQAMRRWPTDNAEQLMEWCDFWGVEFFSSIFSMEGLKIARAIGQQRYKFPSRKAFRSHSDEDYDELLEELLTEGKEVWASGHNVFVVPEYPQYPPIVIPATFPDDKEGYSSHVHGYADATVAIARGAKYIEKHTTLAKMDDSLKDNHFALTFDEFAEMTKLGREMEKYL